uniref:Putative_mat-A3_protein n=1 Tax=Neurospora africana TaxID=5143 RepID=I0J383_NEUAF|nr:putative_mat-A3_protein [Neurospora africana]
MSTLDVDAISDIAPGLSPVTALHYGRIQVMLFRSHLVDFAEEDLVYAMDNSVAVFGEEALLMVAPDETSIAICTYPVGLMMMEWGNWDILAVSPPPQTPAQVVAGLWNSEHPAAKARFMELAEMEVRRHRAENPHLYPDQSRFPTTDPVPPRMRYPYEILPEDRQRILRMLDFVWEESNGQLAAEEAAVNDAVQPQQAEEIGPFPDYEWEEPTQIIDMSTDLSVAQDPDFMITEDDSMGFLLKQAC